MKNLFALLIFLGLSASAAEYSETQDIDVVGKTMWIYFNMEECQQNFHLYKGKLSSDEYKSTQPTQIRVKELVDSWIYGPYYKVALVEGQGTELSIYSKEINDYRGSFKHLYLAGTSPNLVLLNAACISDVDPNEKVVLNQQAKQAALEKAEQERLDDNARAEEEKRAKALADAEKAKIEEAERVEMAAVREKRIVELPKLLKSYSVNDLCLLRGNHLTELNVFDQTDPRAKKFILDEIKRRGVKLSSQKDFDKYGKVFLGMSTCDLYISKGDPIKENIDYGSWGIHIQHIYNGMYVYSENGTVTSLQLR